MKKFLLLLVAAVLACGLVLSCSQPSAYDITLKAGSAEGVAPDSIKVEAINGYNLITWKSTPDTRNSYTVYRKTIIDGEIDEGTIKVVGSGLSTVSPIKGIAYTSDSSIEADIQYVYGIVSRGFKEGTGTGDVLYISDLVWQDEPEGGYVKAKKPAAGSELPAAPTVTATIVRVNNTKTGLSTWTDVADGAVITLKGLTPGYSYRLGIATTNWVNPLVGTAPTLNEVNWGGWNNTPDGTDSDITNAWIQINGADGVADTDVFSVANYLDYGDTLELSEVDLGIIDYLTTNKTSDNWKARLYVRIGVGTGLSGVTYPRTSADSTVLTGTRFATNEIKLIDNIVAK